MIDAAETLDDWTWAARDKARKQKAFTVSAPTYLEAQRLAAHRMGFTRPHYQSGGVEYETAKVEVRVLSFDEIEKLRSREAA